ncbi:MAG: hypothetical protein O7G83_00060 [Proteobacteria bacterium]|nr:hypothetical protein [Pseudomonadota bacterium]
MNTGTIIFTLLIILAPYGAGAQDATTDDDAAEPAASAEKAAVDSDQPKTMSGMSILGNEEAPKALVIIPWKSSELGDDITLSDSLDDRARPVDREVFLRELSFYAIRANENQE